MPKWKIKIAVFKELEIEADTFINACKKARKEMPKKSEIISAKEFKENNDGQKMPKM